MDAGHMPIRSIKGDLAAFVTELFNSFEKLAHKKQIHYDLNIMADLFEICFDTDVLEKIVTNLVSYEYTFF